MLKEHIKRSNSDKGNIKNMVAAVLVSAEFHGQPTASAYHSQKTIYYVCFVIHPLQEKTNS